MYYIDKDKDNNKDLSSIQKYLCDIYLSDKQTVENKLLLLTNHNSFFYLLQNFKE